MAKNPRITSSNSIFRPISHQRYQSQAAEPSQISYESNSRLEEGQLIAKADERRKKMEALLEKLSERYENRKTDGQKREEELDDAIKETEEKTDKMKTMIENLKYKLANSRPGVNTLDTANLAEPILDRTDSPPRQYYHTTAPPVHIDQVGEMIGEKLRDMQVGIHTLDLDDMLDLDNIQIKNRGEDSNKPLPDLPVPPPGYDFKPKRQVLHPKLTRQRPDLGKAKLPSINLKSYITPATEAPNPVAEEYKERPIIPRYIDEAIPTPQPQFQEPESKVQVKYLPPRQGPRLKGYKNKDMDIKELERLTFPVFEYDSYHQSQIKSDNKHEDKTEKSDGLPPPIFYSEIPENFNPITGPYQKPPEEDVVPYIEPEPAQEYESKYISSSSYRTPDPSDNGLRTSKEYSLSGYTRFPPPSYNYKQPNIRFDESAPTKQPSIHVTPKNTPVTTPTYVQSLPTQAPTKSYAPPPYRPPSYEAKVPDYYTPPSEGQDPKNPKAEHISSLSPPARGYVPPLGFRGKDVPPQKPYHSPRPSYMSKMYPPRSGYVPPSIGNYVSTISPPSHGYSTPLPHVSSISPPHKGYIAPTYSTTMQPPDQKYSTPKPTYVSSISPPKYGYSNPPPYPSMEPPKESYAKPINSYVSTMSPPQKGYDSHLSTMKPPEGHYEGHHEGHYEGHSSTMKPPSHGYKEPQRHTNQMKPPSHAYNEPQRHTNQMKPPSHSYESGIKEHLSKIPPPPKDNYLPPDPKMKEYSPPTGEHFSALQPNYREAMKPPKSSYEEGMKSIMAKLSLPEQEFLEHAMSGQTYLPPSGDYKPPAKLTKDHPPTSDYMDTMFRYLKEMNIPMKEYLPPKDDHYKPPQEAYDSGISDYMSSMHLPRKGYLPPDEHSKYTPPSKDYKDPVKDYMGKLHAPDSSYLPPKPKGYHMEPPSSSYEKPLLDYMSHQQAPNADYAPPHPKGSYMTPPASSYEEPITDYMTKLNIPDKDYLPPHPKGSYMKPPASSYEHGMDYMTKLNVPDKDYLPPNKLTGFLPELASYLSPISEYMASMLPPKHPYKAYKETMKPPANDYAAPHDNGEYLTPFKPSSLDNKDPRLLAGLFPPGPAAAGKTPASYKPLVTRYVCPPASKDVKCEYVKHQCWSPGTPDTDCPGEGLCCFNGCVNVCLPPPSIISASAFHIPPSKAYLVPGQENFYIQSLLTSMRRQDGISDTFAPPMQYSLAALDSDVEISGLPDRPTVSQLPEKANMLPPLREYLPPVDGYQHPNYENVDVSEIKRPLTKYLPPTVNYQVSHEQVEQDHARLRLPVKEYLPPDNIGKYSPPASDYKLPKKLETLVPPSNDYLPPDNMQKYSPPSQAYQVPGSITKYNPPVKEYIPPKELLKPPTSDYLAPVSENYEPLFILDDQAVPSIVPPSEPFYGPVSSGVQFHPPSQDYIPPSLKVSDPYHEAKKGGAHLAPPDKQYLPPQPEHYGEDTLLEGIPFRPPSKEYLLPTPHEENYNHASFAPPHKDYIPPTPTALPHHISHPEEHTLAGFHPPSKEYLPPKTIVAPDGATFRPPVGDYVSPTSVLDNTYKPPTKDYLPPPTEYKDDPNIPEPPHPSEIPHGDLPTLVPPNKEYLPPPSNNIEEIGHAIHIAEHHEHHVNVPPALLPKPGVPDYHVTAHINSDGVLEPHHGVVSKIGPHSINIQINLPEKDKPHYHEEHPTIFRTPSYSGQKPDKILPHMLPHEHDGHHDHEHKVMPHMLPHGDHQGYKHAGPPPTLPKYVPPPISTTYEDSEYKHYKQPKYLPPRQYHPSHHRLPPKEYLPTNPIIYNEGYKKPSYESKEPELLIDPMQTLKPPLDDFFPPSDLKAPVKADGYIPPDKATLRPPDKDYLPPAEREEATIPKPPNPEDIPADIDIDIDDGFQRGSQFPSLTQKDKEYARPPPRPGSLDVVIEDILNSQVSPKGQGKEKYIPPKTKFDVPTNFIRPDDLLRAPRPGLQGLDYDPDDAVDEFGTIDILDADELPEPPIPESVSEPLTEPLTEQPFLGLAKLVDPDRKKSLKELEQLRAEVKKLAKLVEKESQKGPQLPPIPTVPSLLSLQQLQQKLPPQPSSFVPFLEKLEPSVLQQLQTGVRNQNKRDGKIPGKPGVDYPDFKTIPATDFSCENFLLEGFYADTFTSCQVNIRFS